MSDLVINVKQVSSYPLLTQSAGTETMLLQANGLGGPYQSISSAALVSTALNNSNGLSSLGVGQYVPALAGPGNVLAGLYALPTGSPLLWNGYYASGQWHNWQSGVAAGISFNLVPGWQFFVSASAQHDQPLVNTDVMTLSVAGNANLPLGTLSVARDPAANNEVATLGWVGKNTVASFNNRIGQVTLNAGDVYAALQLTSAIATQAWVNGSINQAIGNFAQSYPLVNSWNGRTGDVYLMLSDISCVFYQSGQQPVSPTPVATSNDDSIATTKWVTTYITNELSGSGGTLASQSWVLANTVNSFNGRLGQVTLTAADVTSAGGAPLNSPNFSGIPAAPTANPGTSTAQVATTAFVQAAVQASTTGVASFNGRTGAVVLTGADISGAGGLSNPNVNLTGIPTAPTAAANTNTTQIASTQFVQAAVGASVVTFNTRTGAVSLLLTDITGAGGAPLASPTFTGTPAAPTASPGTNTTQLATTQFVTAALTAAGGVSSFNSRTGAVTLTSNDLSAAGGLVNPSVTLTGTPTAPTATAGTNTQQIATTAFVETALTSGAVLSFNTRQGAVTLQGSDITAAGGALLAGPAFTGAPTAPTAAPGTSNTQLATTAFVSAAIAGNTATVTSFNTRTGAVVLTTADITAAGGAPLNNPALTGTPTAPTATAGTNTTQIATTQFVQSALASSGVASFNTRTGAVTLLSNDISAAGGALVASPTFTGIPAAPTATAGTNTTQLATTSFVATSFAPLASPALTGTPTAPTATAGTNSTQLATTAFVTTGLATKLNLSGGTLTGLLTVPASGIAYGSGPAIAWTAPTASILSMTIAAGGAYNAVISTYINGTQWSVQQMLLNINGSMFCNVGTTTAFDHQVSWATSASDRKLKSRIRPVEVDALAIVNQAKVWACDLTFPGQGGATQAWDCALIADEVRELVPAAFIEPIDKEKGHQGLNALPLVATLFRAVQQLTARVLDLEATGSALRAAAA